MEEEQEENEGDEDPDESLDERQKIAEEECREVFDPVNGTVDMRKKRCTDIKTNPRVYLPKARPADEEAEFFVRGRRIMDDRVIRECG